jgi:hypothetical protein
MAPFRAGGRSPVSTAGTSGGAASSSARAPRASLLPVANLASQACAWSGSDSHRPRANDRSTHKEQLSAGITAECSADIIMPTRRGSGFPEPAPMVMRGGIFSDSVAVGARQQGGWQLVSELARDRPPAWPTRAVGSPRQSSVQAGEFAWQMTGIEPTGPRTCAWSSSDCRQSGANGSCTHKPSARVVSVKLPSRQPLVVYLDSMAPNACRSQAVRASSGT